MQHDDPIEYFEIFPWDTNFETGIEHIDKQHKRLVDILNRLAAHLANRSHPSTLNSYFDELADYADYHFQSEEQVWEKYLPNDIWLTEHQESHGSFIEHVVALRQEEGEKPLDDVLQDIITYLSKWLAYHILDNDKRMAKVVLALESGCTLAEAKARSNEEMSGSTRLFIQTVLTMYERLTTRTMDIMREKSLRKEMETKLREAKEEAERATRSKSMFLAHMSHEIRTPMHAIIGMTNMVMQTQLDEKQRDSIDKIHRSAENLLRIVNEVLDFSRVESGKLVLELVNFELQSVIENLLFITETNARGKRIRMMVDIDPQIPPVMRGDPLRLGQVLINLVSNAVKFSPENSTVTVSACLLDTTEDTIALKFSIKDSGIGMTLAQQQKLFRSFSQADASTAREYGGSGLGLLISKMIVEVMGGKIWVESEKEHGSTFHFTVTLANCITVSTVTEEDAVDQALQQLKGARVLLVEDNEINREIAVELLTCNGIHVEIATNGKEALELLEIHDFDGVLMDCQMPVMDGYEATREIRKQPRFQSLPILAMSAEEMDSDSSLPAQSGMNDHITKPIDVSQMWITMSRWIRPIQ
ncbi:bacteriohemerythrin [Mariprofundus erugo]|uniref:Sensory/regulatory protein RpfC n=1 Tax=Mariprofundus erugo TaxID=2528639 RepID=A0A5R9GMI8_9PROT|nr:bacteriohemerythrin [Mariprofundus erugo]TLS65643.1 bacteriohemerythrin [Mariprofundus erugo]